ncbi:trypsin-like [Amyelois transitella]|uniref:trypsin-like n=1 Tax=Amyelois transitella TaxID=680683 RepID=UPI00298FCAC0|nr:trypsin-like [Amyelois transitella]
MNFIGILVVIISQCSIALTATSNRADMGLGRIVGGHEAKAHGYPFMVSLQLRFLWVRAHFCGGTLISDSWILTAGHCIKGSWILYLLGIDAVAGAHDVDFPGPTAQIIRIAERIPHPEYKGDIGPHDIGLVKTKHPFQFTKEIQPIQLAMDPIIYPSLTLIGWGELRTTWFFPALPSKLQEVKQEYLPHEACYKAVDGLLGFGETNPLVEYANICTGPITGGIAACNGDSGGPLIDIDYVPVILGVVSWGVTPCGEEGAPTVFTNVTDNMKFIVDTTKIK